MRHTLTDLSREPGLAPEVDRLIGENMPEFMSWESPGNWRWNRLYELFPRHQLCAVDEDGGLLAAANGLPVRWDGTAEGLPGGADDVLVDSVDHPPERPDALCMLSVSVAAGHRRAGLAERLLTAARDAAAAAGLRGVLIPVRPTRKHHYPLIPMDRYAAWRRADGSRFDPWLRTHLDLGARLLSVAERSLVIRQPVARWERALGRAMPEAGDYLLPGALSPVRVTADGFGTYTEPNVWVHHPSTPTN
ncbi:GNAT family N-acetyltransferase [Streptomyces sp. NPDC018045]|uniref:GNAT family N-acetyltransferase n=1 Tax=Streptomyces sp. NPDC018045 TaxID=3365037 RepID=UPI0037BBDED0